MTVANISINLGWFTFGHQFRDILAETITTHYICRHETYFTLRKHQLALSKVHCPPNTHHLPDNKVQNKFNITSHRCDAVAFLPNASISNENLARPILRIQSTIYNAQCTLSRGPCRIGVKNYLEVFFFTIVEAAACF